MIRSIYLSNVEEKNQLYENYKNLFDHSNQIKNHNSKKIVLKVKSKKNQELELTFKKIISFLFQKQDFQSKEVII
jgi:hypothetical protein